MGGWKRSHCTGLCFGLSQRASLKERGHRGFWLPFDLLVEASVQLCDIHAPEEGKVLKCHPLLTDAPEKTDELARGFLHSSSFQVPDTSSHPTCQEAQVQ